MGYLHTTEDLFLADAEIRRMIQFLGKDGFRSLLMKQTGSFGIVKSYFDTEFKNFKVELGDTAETVKISNTSVAIDKNANLIVQKPINNFSIPTDNRNYWIIVKHTHTSLERGVVSVDTMGNVTGVGTEFTNLLRGEPELPSRIRFIGSSLNIQEYDVHSVIDDNNIILNGVFQNESELGYEIIGTFTPGYVVPEEDKGVFRYDGCEIRLLSETVVNQVPQLEEGLEFAIARVFYSNGNLKIEDKRTQLFKSDVEQKLFDVSKLGQQIVGVESVKYPSETSVRSKNRVNLSWGFTARNWSAEHTQNKLTISGGSGGILKETNDFTTGLFDGWRVYNSKGGYSLITSSTKSGSQINLIVDSLNPSDFSSDNNLLITPNADSIEFLFKVVGKSVLTEYIEFPINKELGTVDLDVFSDNAAYNVAFRLRRISVYTNYNNIPNDNKGYYAESSFDSNGTLYTDVNNQTLVPYTDGNITLRQHPESYKKFKEKVITGDLFGVDVNVVNSQTSSYTLEVGREKQQQYFTSSGSISLFSDLIVNINSEGAKVGNSFQLDFKLDITNHGSNTIKIYSNYMSTSGNTNLLKVFTPTEIDYMRIPRRTVSVKLVYIGDGTWILSTVETDKAILFNVEMRTSVNINDFDENGLGFSEEFLGYALCLGKHGTPDMREKFVVGFTPETGSKYPMGATGGEEKVTLKPEEFNHNHTITGSNKADNGGFGAVPGVDQTGEEPAGTTSYVAGNDSAVKPHENRPPYYAIAFVQRIKYVG